ncbi:hypothetical protein LSTR_LSTR013235 [Laodelphax striatellus]|uniref:C2H2-type domain-containing protein n=1 Tax=Laodelphax striatellus TaxID=195883 RepID=A0A482XM55_LAOST|nr:hypothetical protein LSTR_LSTR013235 [Laodelphax striatellus]
MTSPMVNCPLCCQPAYSSLAALSMSLISVATKSLDCPVCPESLPGLDKFTIHIFGHALNHEISHKTQQNGVLKVIAGTSSQNIVPIDLGFPVFIRRIDCSTNVDSFVIKSASNFDDSPLVSSNNDDNNNNSNDKNIGNIDDTMFNTSQVCESNNNIDTNCDNVSSNNNECFITNIGNIIGTKHDNTTSGNSIAPDIDCRIDTNCDNVSSNSNKCFVTDTSNLIGIDNTRNIRKGVVTDIGFQIDDTNCENVTRASNEGFITNISNRIGTNNDNTSSKNSMEGVITDSNCQIDTNLGDNDIISSSNMKVVVTSFENHIGTSNDNSRNDTNLKYSNDGEEAAFSDTNSMVQEDDNVAYANDYVDYDTSMKNTTNSTVSDYRACRMIQENENNVRSECSTSCMKNTDNSTPRYDVLGSGTILQYSQDSSNDLLKNLEPYIKYSAEKVDKKIGNPSCVEGNTGVFSMFASQNDALPSKTKIFKKDVKVLRRKICKKIMDSTMTTQGVQTMEESFTKNNNPFGKVTTIDKTNEEFLNPGERVIASDRRSLVSDGRNLVFDGENRVSGGRNLVSDGRNLVTDEESRGFYMKDMASEDVTFESRSTPVENNGSVVCEFCLFTFPDDKILQMHKKLVHSDCDEQKKTFSCHLCSKSFNMRGSLMVHRRVAHPVLSGGQVSLKNIERIKEVKASTSFDETSPQFTCKTCGKSFKKEQHLTQHERTHEVKQWDCDICSKVFSTKYFLKKHKRLHTGEMPYTCATCGKSFTFQQSYHKHLLYHSDEKPHVCCECGRAFKELSTLHNHQRIHTGEKPFACETCGKCFRQRVSYLVHRRIHTGVMPYKCTICNKSFRYKVSERTHKCSNATQGHVVDRVNEVVEKLKKLEGTNSNSNQSSSTSKTSASSSLHTTPSNTVTSNEVGAENCSNTLQQDLNHSTEGVVQLKQPPCDRMDEGGQEFWTEISKTTPNQRNMSSDHNNIFTGENSDDFLSFVLTPTFSPSEQFQNLTLSPDSVRNRERGTDGTRNTEEGTVRHGYHDGNFETINEQSLKELLDNVDVL